MLTTPRQKGVNHARGLTGIATIMIYNNNIKNSLSRHGDNNSIELLNNSPDKTFSKPGRGKLVYLDHVIFKN